METYTFLFTFSTVMGAILNYTIIKIHKVNPRYSQSKILCVNYIYWSYIKITGLLVNLTMHIIEALLIKPSLLLPSVNS